MELTRRRFIELAGCGAAALAVAPSRWAAAHTASGRLPRLPELDLRRDGRVVYARLEASPSAARIGHHNAALWLYNHQFPGPTLRLREGDTLRLKFVNNLPEATNLHFHGMHLPPTGLADDPFRHIAPGETANYEFTVPQGAAGVYWYHPHMHGRVSYQLYHGLAGAIVVEDSGALATELQDIPDHLLALKDVNVDADGHIPDHNKMDWMMGREGNLVTVNGALSPELEVTGGIVRLRLCNMSNARFYRLRLPHAFMRVLAVDGAYVDRPYVTDELLLPPAQRYQVLVRFSRAGTYDLMDLPYNRAPEMTGGDHAHMGSMDMSGAEGHAMEMPGMDMGSSGEHGSMSMDDGHMQHHGGGHSGSHSGAMAGMAGADGNRSMIGPIGQEAPRQLLRLHVSAPASGNIPALRRKVRRLTPADAVRQRRIVFEENMDALKFFINGRQFRPGRIDQRTKLGTVELWEVVNKSGMDHPFHIHTNLFQVYARNGRPEPRTIWCDTVNILPNESVQILIPFEDFGGKTVYHCHIAEHEDLGMMGVVEMA